jgi:hypothetical protein
MVDLEESKMAKQRTVKLERSAMMAMAALSTTVAANIMVALANKGIFSDDDVEQIIGVVETGGFGDAGLDTMAKMMAAAMRTQIAARAN